MNQEGRLTARGFHGRLKETLERYRAERDRTAALVQEAYEELDHLRELEQDKLDNIEFAGTGLENTLKAEAIRNAVDILNTLVEELEQLSSYLDITEVDSASIDLDDLFKISKP